MSVLHIPFYPSDWLAGTRGLSDAETGVYITLIARMYEMAGPIERDDNRLFKMCGCKSKASFVKALDHLIDEGKIVVTADGLFNDRVQKEIAKVVSISAKAAKAAKARWTKDAVKKSRKSIKSSSSFETKPQSEFDGKFSENNGGAHAVASLGHMPQLCHSQPEPEPKPDLTDISDLEQALIAAGFDSVEVAENYPQMGEDLNYFDHRMLVNELGLTDSVVREVIRKVASKKKDGRVSSFKYFDQALRRKANNLLKAGHLEMLEADSAAE